LKRLIDIYNKPVRTVVGLMSGTSHDGVDAAVARIKGSGGKSTVELVSHSHVPYPDRLRADVGGAMDGPTSLVCRLNFELGEFFAKAALKAIEKAGLRPDDVDLIGSHGQTIYHIPAGSTLQIGEGAVIARRTGVLTISDFRTADVAAGGQGAPLVPLADWIIFKKPGEVTALQNIGGIANVTVVTESLDDVTGFDTGPGNALIDEAVRILSSGRFLIDKGGKLARSGKFIPKLLDNLLAHPYYKMKPPKSTGRETFGRPMAAAIISKNRHAGMGDMLSTLTHLTARSIKAAYDDFVFPAHRPDRVVVCGGGARNGFLVSLIEELFAGIPVSTIDDLGVPAEAREALCFAVLANETVAGNPGNVPKVTGAKHPAVLGKVSF